MSNDDFNQDRLLQQDIKARLQDLNNAIDLGDVSTVRSLIGSLTQMKEESIHQELGKLTRELHNTIAEIDVAITENDIPDARDRLNNVISMTEAAANKTMDIIDTTIPLSNNLADEAKKLLLAWNKFKRHELTIKEFGLLYDEMMEFLQDVEKTSSAIHKNLQDILVAQNYQDLSGQAIKKVIQVVAKVEKKLVRLVTITAEVNGCFIDAGSSEVSSCSENKITQETEATKVVASQDEVDDLLSSLGF